MPHGRMPSCHKRCCYNCANKRCGCMPCLFRLGDFDCREVGGGPVCDDYKPRSRVVKPLAKQPDHEYS